MGPLPIKTDLLEYDTNSSMKIFESLWGSVSTLIINKSEQKKKPIYYAEKIPHDILPIIVKSIGSRVIYLIRDPRDELSSILEFNKKRCTNNFGWRENDTIESFTERFIVQRKNYFAYILNNSANSIVIKYEDLVLDRKGSIDRLSSYLGINFKKSISSNFKINKSHMTSATPAQSIGKWNDILPANIVKKINNSLIQELSLYEYA